MGEIKKEGKGEVTLTRGKEMNSFASFERMI